MQRFQSLCFLSLSYLLLSPSISLATSQLSGSGVTDGALVPDALVGYRGKGDNPSAFRGQTSVHYGSIDFESEVINTVFTASGHQVLYLDTGVSYKNILELSVGAGFIQEMGWLLSEDGSVSDEHDMLTVLPLNASTTLRLDFFEEQLLVPYASAGLDYWVWRENWMSPGADGDSAAEEISGAKIGSHWSVGGQLLLDSFDPSGASRTALKTGIQDSYFQIEYRSQTIGDSDGLSFDSSSWTAGMRFNY